MSIIKSFSVGLGDMYYIKHGTSNFTIIDCCLSDENRDDIIKEIKKEKKNKEFTRFISTHPDGDHIQQLQYFDDEIDIVNFYCVKNEATKPKETDSFKRYCELRDSDKSFFIKKDCTRKFMNESGKDKNGNEYKHAGVHILWPDISNEEYKKELIKAKEGTSFNNISCIINYRLNNGISAIWMGDLLTEFMDKVIDEITLPKANIVFAPHHGRKSGKIPQKWLDQMDPDIIIMGEASSNDSDYSSYGEINIIRQNSAEDITFECEEGKVHIYVSNENYTADFLDQENKSTYDNYIGTLNI